MQDQSDIGLDKGTTQTDTDYLAKEPFRLTIGREGKPDKGNTQSDD